MTWAEVEAQAQSDAQFAEFVTRFNARAEAKGKAVHRLWNETLEMWRRDPDNANLPLDEATRDLIAYLLVTVLKD